MDVAILVAEALADPGTGWSMGAPGAVAEFVRTADEQATVVGCDVVTERGGLRVLPSAAVTAVAYETPVGPADHWNHAVALCVPAARDRGACRSVVTELGPDVHALRARHRPGVLFDLGLGLPNVEACVRVTEPELLRTLRAGAGVPLFTQGELVGRLVTGSPHRVFTSACGRVEVYASIPPPEGRSPDGPHTHLLPAVMRHGRTHAATVPVPGGMLPVAHLYPPHPLTEPDGRRIAFDVDRLRAFELLLDEFGDPAQAAVTAAVRLAVHGGRGPEAAPPVVGAPERAALAVALRKLAHTGASRELLDRWRARVPAAQVDPEGDRNA